MFGRTVQTASGDVGFSQTICEPYFVHDIRMLETEREKVGERERETNRYDPKCMRIFGVKHTHHFIDFAIFTEFS